GEASAFGASKTHGTSVFPHLLAPCRVAKRSGKAQKKQQVFSTSEALLFFLNGVARWKKSLPALYLLPIGENSHLQHILSKEHDGQPCQ
ncbi:MAG: hypothetical protein IJT83_07735, partial [Victivallales bacterium]|nr:hypothetical protein [Victivallales bacterium]